MRRKKQVVNLADREASMELLKQLYGKEVMDGQQVQVESPGDERGQSTANARPVDEIRKNSSYPHTERR